MHFNNTDLPEPEPPITTSDVRGMTSKVDAIQHDLVAETFANAAQADLGTVALIQRSMPAGNGAGKVYLLADRWSDRTPRQEDRPMNDNIQSMQTLAHRDAGDGEAGHGPPRVFLLYLDLGVTDAASNGAMRAQVTKATQGLGQPTGWHYHVCDQQFVYMVKGWVDLEFEDGRKIRLKAGDSLDDPGRHAA